MEKPKTVKIRRDWWAKISAGTLLGFMLAFGCSGLFITLATGMANAIKAQLAMWMIAPIWLGILSGVFIFHNGRRAWLWLSGANLLVFGVLIAIRTF